MAWVAVGFVAALGFGFVYLAQVRARKRAPLPEAAPGRHVEDLSEGRFRVVGRVVGEHTVASTVDQSPCVYLERAEYRTVGSDLLPVLRQVEHAIVANSFYVDDGTGRVRIDPEDALLDAVTIQMDDGLVAERRLRAGEEVEVVATFEPRLVERDGGPYRSGVQEWHAVNDDWGPPRVSYRTEPEMLRPIDDVVVLFRGMAALAFVAASALAVLHSIL
ncbi:MAG: hypothetical protein AAGF12_23425 [Myxococcota bacterium]